MSLAGISTISTTASSQRSLWARMRQLIKDSRVLDLIWRIVKDGVMIGAYTSQWFANTVLQPLDQLIRQSGYAKHYVRYMDNLSVFGSNKRRLRKLRLLVETWINDHDLKLKGDWQVFPTVKKTARTPLKEPRRGHARPTARMPDAVGYRYGRATPFPASTTFYASKAIARYHRIRDSGKRIFAGVAASILSRCGQLKHCNNVNLYKIIFRGERLVRELKKIVREKHRKETLTWSMYLAQRERWKSSRSRATPIPT